MTANTANCNGIGNPQTLFIESGISYQGYEESVGFKGQATATIFYHDNDCDRVIKKPIIITDGFDPGSTRAANNIYKLLVYKSGVIDSSNLALELIHAGYDVIILDYPQYPKNGKMIDGGSDYIQRNAYSLIKLINTVNGMKASNADSLIIVGPSMGGLISRYALTYMEHHNMPHKTKLWVSFDAPHLGANIPIGDQWMLKYLGVDLNKADAKKKLEEKINTPAAKEMIIHHYLSGQQTPTPYYTRNLFMQELDNLGFPVGDPGKTIRNIALINGSGTGTLKNSFGQLALQFSERPTTTTRIIGGVLTLLNPKRLFFKIVFRVLGLIPSATTGFIDTKVWFTPGYNASNKVFQGSMLSGAILKRQYFAGTPNNSIGLDNAPGGLYDTQKQIKDGLYDALHKGVIRVFYKPVFDAFIPDHGFIPTKSSLAVTSVTNFGENFSNRSLVCTGETPFNSYFTPDENQEHIFLTKQSVDYITKEINGIHQLPLIKSTLAISGPALLCTSQAFTIPGLPSGTTVNWSVNYTGIANLTPSGNSVVLTKISNGSVILTANITSSCSRIIVSKEIVIGTPNASVSSYIDRTPQSSHYQYVTATAVQIPGTVPSNYSWYRVLNGNSTFISSGLQLVQYGIPPCSVVYYKLVATTQCGDAIYNGYAYNSYCSSSSKSTTSMVTYPNPANTEVNISNTDTEGLKSDAANIEGATVDVSRAAFQVSLYDEKGNLIRSAKNPKGSNGIKLNVSEVPNGTYFIHVLKGKETTKQQIIISH